MGTMSATGSPKDPTGVPRGADVAVTVARHERALVLHVAGEIDLLTVPRLEEALDAALAEAPEIVVADLTAVSFLSSVGMAALVRARQQAGEGTDVRVVAKGDVTFRPMELTGLTSELAVYPTVSDALADG